MHKLKFVSQFGSLLFAIILIVACTQNNSTDNSQKPDYSKRSNKNNVSKKDNVGKKKKVRNNGRKIIIDNETKNGKLDYTKAFVKNTTINKAINRKGVISAKLSKRSKISFTGKKLIGKHSGSIPINGGKIFLDKNKELVGGNFSIDVKNLVITDLKGKGKTSLEGHLKSADFFNVKKHPTASFDIVNVKKANPNASEVKIEGNLTMNGVTKSIIFPATFKSTNGNDYKASAKFTIDRTQWGIHYGNDRSLKDKFIKPTVDLIISLSGTF